jgi:S-adenosylmethionine synthetase
LRPVSYNPHHDPGWRCHPFCEELSVSTERYLFTSESVSMGHPDKVADQISDAILDHCLAADPASRVACETLVTTDLAVVAGEITTHANLSRSVVDRLVRDTIREIGYVDPAVGFAADTCQVVCHLHAQSRDIACGVDTGGAGDQGMMFGFACRETQTLMPLPIYLAHRLVENHARLRRSGELDFIRPDAKSQVTVEYNADGTPHRIHTVVLSTQHNDHVMVERGGQNYFSDAARRVIVEKLIFPTLFAERPDLVPDPDLIEIVLPGQKPRRQDGKAIHCHINPTGVFLEGGPHGDCGLTGRKIIVDTYGGRGRHGGGAFSGKDPTKVDRSAAYVGRYIAKNVVAAGLADQCEVQLSYAIGYPEPINIWVSTFGTAAHDLTDTQIADLVREHFPLTPRGIIEALDLRRPIYRETARHGHFGRELPSFTWEKTDRAAALCRAVGVAA